MAHKQNKWLLYGANGYTGQLIARRAVAEGQQPILAGRSEQTIKKLAADLDCEYRIFGLGSKANFSEHLADVSLVLNCAGPFRQTAGPLIGACLQSGVHYLDITGEWQVIEQAAAQDAAAKDAGVVILPAVGFDVVPSDCLALTLAKALPTATQLELAFRVSASGSAISPGTATTIFSQLGEGPLARREGRIQPVVAPWETVRIPFASGERPAIPISWGDIASAYHSTGIPNIRVFQAISKSQLKTMQRWHWIFPLAGWSPIQWLGRRWIRRNIPGPSEKERAQSQTEFWGRATDEAGGIAEVTLLTLEGYTLTSLTSLETVRRVLAGEALPGFSTPAMAFGADYIEQFEGVKLAWQHRP